MKTVSTKFTRVSKRSSQKLSVNRGYSVEKGKLDGTNVNQAHSVTKGSLQMCSVNQVLMVNTRNNFRISVCRASLTKEGFSYVGLIQVFD